jgi:hypothetical protein
VASENPTGLLNGYYFGDYLTSPKITSIVSLGCEDCFLSSQVVFSKSGSNITPNREVKYCQIRK